MHKYFSQYFLNTVLLFICFTLLFPATSKAENKEDSILIKEYNKVVFFNSDTIFSNYADYGFKETVNDLYEYYEDVFAYLPLEKRKEEIRKMQQIAEKKNSPLLLKEAGLLEIFCLPEEDEAQIFHKADKLIQLSEESAKMKDACMQMRSMEAAFDLYWRRAKYARAFKQIYSMDKALQNVSDEEFPLKEAISFRIGEAYFFFKDYNKAMPYLRKAMVPSKLYIDRTNLKAINTVGIYYSLKGKIDSSDYYFRLAYNSSDKVKSRTIYDGIALTNLGYNLIKKKRYDEAIPYFRAGFAYMLDKNAYKSASDVAVGLAQCYFGKGDMRKAGQLIDSSLIYIEKSGNNDLYKSLYPLMCEYYIKTGDKAMATAYMDSTIAFNERYLNKYNSTHIMRAEQELFEAENNAQSEELRYQKEIYNERFLYGVLIIMFISLGLVVFIILYRRNRNAYRALVQKNQDWASSTATVFEKVDVPVKNIDVGKDLEDEPAAEDVMLMKEVHELIKTEKVFKELDLTLESLSKQMNVNRNYLSKAINKTTGKNFNTFINEYRIKEAIKIMSDEKSDLISIDAIALEVGFNNRISFYQSFKKITGLTPSDFRNNKVVNMN
ncbi:AraC-like DNA-binding protein/Tfp pilus assembly protein PilF [Dysgonomonas hofstadii]|uniref:AraC-like DNA-binding protein/Tfp pilus assembly protein PilF n=1 Tax=Dysgonomonas hofstadii TaxID=637886 RepID=A0A840CR95_9BACT|nr:helix-turn-helix domain-containing protein [Dysgonomonas hofstadii]MBB4037946.1 AraC-like DNA-binding protein/Tfp pilus assembly protein PilF [Dysgonomonas hofstadii]